MSVYRRRVMQVKHPPNQITAVYNVTSTTSATTLCNANAKPYLQSVIVNGEDIGAVNTYVFPTTGNHNVQLVINNSTQFNGDRFFYNTTRIVSADFSQFKSPIVSAHYMFYKCSLLKSVKGLNVSGVITMYRMFDSCSSLTTLDVSSWDVSKVTQMTEMFDGCSSLTTLDVSSWDVSNVEVMQDMFQRCSSLTTLDVSSWDTSKVTNMARMFNGCQNLKTLDVSSWDTSKVTQMYAMFNGCKSLTTLDVSSWDVSQVIHIYTLFANCANLTNLDLSSWNASKATNLQYFFDGCKNLKTIDLSSWDISKATSMCRMFGSCSVLQDLYFNSEISASADITDMFASAGSSSSKLYYYPYATFTEKILPIIPSTWTAIDITTLE